MNQARLVLCDHADLLLSAIAKSHSVANKCAS